MRIWLYSSDEADALLRALLAVEMTPEVIRMYGRDTVTRRRSEQYGADYIYNLTAKESREWTPLMLSIRERRESVAGPLHGGLVQVYPDGETGIGWHRDKGKPEIIASLRIIALSREPFATMYAVLACTGIRAGECLALKVADLDFNKGLIRIRRTLDDRTRQVLAPKSRSSSADLPMPNILARRLRNYLTHHRPDNADGWLFFNTRGNPFSRNKVVYRLQATLRELGIPRAGLHGFRHMAASELLESGAAPSVVQKQMRHSDARITLESYAHVIGDAQRKAVESLARSVLGD